MIYVASPYSHADEAVREDRYIKACKFTAALLRNRINAFSPIAHSHVLVQYDLPTTWEFWEKVDTEHVQLCSSVLVLQLPGWDQSRGVTAEIKMAEEQKKPVIYMPYIEVDGVVQVPPMLVATL